MPISSDGKQEISLVVLQHGLWGVKGHMGYIEKKLKEKYDDSVYIVSFERDLPFFLLETKVTD